MLTALLEVVVVDDRSRDRTRRILASLEERFSGRLRVVEGEEPPPGWLVNVPAASLIGAGGGVFNLVRRGAYDAIGGHAAQKDFVVDDILLGVRAKRAGFRCGLALALDAVSVRMYHGFLETLRGFAKNLYWGVGGTLVLAVLAMAARSTWENGVLGRHVWRGRETDARSIRF